MKSIKPGRGPSGMSFMGLIIAIIFGVFWTVIAANITSNSPFGIVGSIFPLFGVLFIIVGIIQAAYHYKNATSKNRFSMFDVTDSQEEGDPSDKWIRDDITENTPDNTVNDMYTDKMEDSNRDSNKDSNKDINYCPYCGNSLSSNFSFCPKCGKRVK